VNVIGFDDGPFPRTHRGDVLLVGVVCAGTRIDGVVRGAVRRDGANATERMIELVRNSPFGHVRAVMLQGIAVGGFNVVDVNALARELDLGVLVVMRRPPDLSAVRRALFGGGRGAEDRPRVRGAARKWRLIERAGPIEPLGPSRRAVRRHAPTGIATNAPRLWIQRAGMTLDEARRLVETTTLHGNLPEPVRVAHLIAGGIATGASHGRA
jgi:endonuclease V-like protein UPF0215 family